MNSSLLHHIALTVIPNVGNITAKKLIAYCGSAEAVFQESSKALEKIPGVGGVNAKKIIENKVAALDIAQKELLFIGQNNIGAICINESGFPQRLIHCEDGPIVLFTKGQVNFNNQKVISIVGTRKATDYGKDFCEQLIENLKPHHPVIVSGLAYGIDICAHKSAVKQGVTTFGVLAHGLDRVYPAQHKTTTKEMQLNGGLVSEFLSGTNPDRENFPKRNRIIAGLADATIVIESSKKGGSLITAELANQYNRDVFALPGRLNDTQSEGCNALIKQNKAHLIQSVKDIEYIMGWEAQKTTQPQQQALFIELNENEKVLVNILKNSDKVAIDQLALKANASMSKTASTLLELEFKGVVKSLPGKIYKLV